MALINCPECSHKISDKAPSCPNCGVHFKEINEVEKISHKTKNKRGPIIKNKKVEKINHKKENLLFRIFILGHWASVIVGMALVILVTLALGLKANSPKPPNYEQLLFGLCALSCALPFLITGIYRILIFVIGDINPVIRLRKYWLNSLAPTIVMIILLIVGYWITEYKIMTKQNYVPSANEFYNSDNNDEQEDVEEVIITPDEKKLPKTKIKDLDAPFYSSELLFNRDVKIYDPFNKKLIKKDGYPAINGLLLMSNNNLIGILNNINRYSGSLDITHIKDFNGQHYALTLNYKQTGISKIKYQKQDFNLYDGIAVSYKCTETGDLFEVRQGGDWKFVGRSEAGRIVYFPETLKAINNKFIVQLFNYIASKAIDYEK